MTIQDKSQLHADLERWIEANEVEEYTLYEGSHTFEINKIDIFNPLTHEDNVGNENTT